MCIALKGDVELKTRNKIYTDKNYRTSITVDLTTYKALQKIAMIHNTPYGSLPFFLRQLVDLYRAHFHQFDKLTAEKLVKLHGRPVMQLVPANEWFVSQEEKGENE